MLSKQRMCLPPPLHGGRLFRVHSAPRLPLSDSYPIKVDKRCREGKKVALAGGIFLLNLRNTIDFLIIKVYNLSIVKLKWGKSGELFSLTGCGIVNAAGACSAFRGGSDADEPIISAGKIRKRWKKSRLYRAIPERLAPSRRRSPSRVPQ